MANVAVINITGIILPEDYIWWEMDATSLYRVKQQVQAAGEFDSILLKICSPGGYCREGWSIVEYLYMLGKPINTLAYGQCMSFGTVFHAMGTVRETTKYCEWMYHRPWDYPPGGNDLQIAKWNQGLVKETNKLFGFYAEQFVKPLSEVIDLIQEDDVYLDPNETIEYGFSTGLHVPGAVASQGTTLLPGFNAPLDPAKKQKPVYLLTLGELKINPDAPKEETPTVEAPKGSQSNLKTNTMAEKKQSLKAAAQSVLDFFKGANPKDLDVSLADGRTMVTDSTGDSPVVGDAATIDDADAADGDYPTNDFGTITITGGVITAIVEADTEDTSEEASASDTEEVTTEEAPATVAALTKQNGELRAELSTLKGRMASAEKRMTAVLGAMSSQEVTTKANAIKVKGSKATTEELDDRQKMLNEHKAKYAPKPPVTNA